MRILTYLLVSCSCLAADVAAAKTLPLAFEAREGEYVSHAPGYSLSVDPSGATLAVRGHVLQMNLAAANADARLEPLDRMPGRVNYFLGRDIRGSYQLYGQVRSHGVYPGIDMLFHGNQQHLEYDFEIAPGRDPENIKIEFDGADQIRIDPSGALLLRAGAWEIRQPVPIAYQVIDGQQTPVPAAYRLDASNQVQFQIGPYDRTRALVIDPQLVFDNQFGGTGVSSAAGVALDPQGNIYVAGMTNAADFPTKTPEQTHPGAPPLLVSADGGQTWTSPAVAANSVRSIASSPALPSTLYAATGTGVIKSTDGGTTWTTPANAGLPVAPVAIAVDAASAATVYAATSGLGVFTSTNGGATWTASTNGLLVPNSTPPSAPEFSGIFANPAVAGTVFAIAQAPDFVYRSTDAGQTWAQVNLPAEGGSPTALVFGPGSSPQLFLAQYNGPFYTSADGGNTWTTLSTSESVFSPHGLAIMPGNPAVLLGVGYSSLSRSADGGKTWTSILPLSLGGVAFDAKNPAVAYALDSSGLYRSVDSGQTWSKAALPLESGTASLFVSPADSRIFVGEGSQIDVFVTKYSPDGSQILYSTYLGGSGIDRATGIAVDSTGSAYIAGVTQSVDFPVSPNGFQKTLAGTSATGPQNAFVSKLSPDGSQLMYSTYLGGGAEQTSRIAIGSAGEAVVTGSSSSANFPVTPGAPQSTLDTSCNPQAPLAVPNAEAAFVTKLAASGGSLVFSTLLGGSCQTYGQALAIDANGNIWTAGATTSPNLPVTKDALQPASGGDIYDGFLARFSPTGSLAYSTYLGGSGYDTVTGVTLDKTGNLYLTGTSGGLNQPASAGAFETQPGTNCPEFSIGPGVYQMVGSAFVLKLDSAAHNTLGLTYMGAPLCLFPSDIAVDSSGNAWIGGLFTPNGSAPQTAGPFQIGIGNGFVSKFSADFSQLLFSTYFDTVNGVTLDSNGLAYAAGAAAPNNTTGTQQAFVAKIDSTPISLSLDSVQNAVNPASPNNSQGIAPGEYLRLLGKNLGPAANTMGIISGGVVATKDAGVQVTFDGVAVPLLSVSATEIDLMAPFELAGKASTTVQVQYQGGESNPVKVAVSPTALQVLAVFNSGFTVNSASNPAQAGSIMTLYVAGAGQTNPASQDGQVNAAPLASAPTPVTMSVFQNNPNTPTVLPVTFAGAAPGLAAGIFQINFVAPPQSLSGINLTVGTGTARLNVTVQ